MQVARVRTESMVQRLAKKPLSEGFELWDRGFPLGAMRLFMFKAESSPPFQMGPCIDAVAYLLQSMNEHEEAAENYEAAAAKYELIQQPLLGALMKVKATECRFGPERALNALLELLQEHDRDHTAHTLTCPKTKNALARMYFTAADLYTKLPQPQFEKALHFADYAVKIGWDRRHEALFLIGRIKVALGDTDGAVEAFQQAIQVNKDYLAPYLELIALEKARNSKKALELLDAAIRVHPRSTLIRDKAYLMSELGDDTKALEYIESFIKDPPVEEADMEICSRASTTCTLRKAQAAILGDMNRLAEAMNAATAALEAWPGDPEAEKFIGELEAQKAISA